MRIAVVGAGFTGLSAAYRLIEDGHSVTIFERDNNPGGLAVGFFEKEWAWSLEKHYHHFFTNDHSALSLAKEINFNILIRHPKTSIFLKDGVYQLDSPLHVLRFPKLNPFERFRMAATLGLLKYNPFWKPLESIQTSRALPVLMGKKAYNMIWEPQLKNKFGNFSNDISLAWFWARIKKRTTNLAYPEGGFLSFAQALCKKIEQMGGTLLFDTEVIEIKSKDVVEIKVKNLKNQKVRSEIYDKAIVTLPTFAFLKIAHSLPPLYKKRAENLKGLGAINVILRLKKQFLADSTYWLSVCEESAPLMAIVEHTNFIDKKYYNNEHIVYLGNYLPFDHPYMKMGVDELLEEFDPFLLGINPSYRSSLIASHLSKIPFAQPVIPVNYSHIMLPFETPLKNVFLANIQQVYPWDRGTNYAIELGEKIAKRIKT